MSVTIPAAAASLEELIGQWRQYLRRRQAIHTVDVSELEDHLREQVAELVDVGLAPDEAFLVAVKRLGNLDTLSGEFAREYSDRLWKQLVAAPVPAEAQLRARRDASLVLGLALLAAVMIKVPALFGLSIEANPSFYLRNLALFVLPLLTAYFVWKRGINRITGWLLAMAFVIAVVFANGYPFLREGSTELLVALHLPIALWMVVGIAYAGGRWNQVSGRMDFVRYSGELFIYSVLIALGGVVFAGFMAITFQSIGIDVGRFFATWLLPCGAVAIVIIASWLVEAKQSVIENMAPVLTRLFTPLFAIMLVTFLGTMVWMGRGVGIEREVLIAFDLVLLMVLALLLYAISARDPRSPPDAFDVMQVVLILSALVADVVALVAVASRIDEFGWSPNRAAALGVNVLLLVNLAWSAVLYLRFLRGGPSLVGLERWQMAYLPVYAGWAALVVIVFPPLFGFV